jgi:hypothetical protein
MFLLTASVHVFQHWSQQQIHDVQNVHHKYDATHPRQINVKSDNFLTLVEHFFDARHMPSHATVTDPTSAPTSSATDAM